MLNKINGIYKGGKIMINNVTLTGRLTAEPEIRYTSNGTPVTTFTLAVNRNFESEQEADFIRMIAWNKRAEIIADYLTKGSLIGVEGSIRTRSWEDEDGEWHNITEVEVRQLTFLEYKKNSDEKTNKSKKKTKRK